MTISYYPNDKKVEMFNKFAEVMEKFPPDENLSTEVLPGAGRGTKDGVEVFSIREIKKGKLEEVMVRTGKILNELSQIQGYQSETKILWSGAEAMEMMDMGS